MDMKVLQYPQGSIQMLLCYYLMGFQFARQVEM